MDNDLVSIGKIVGTFGYKGFFKVLPLTDFPERFKELKNVWLCAADREEELTVEATRPHNELYLVKLQGIETKEVAMTYKNAFLKVREAEIYPLPEGYYYHFQLKQMKVFDDKLGYLGKLVEVLETGANDVYVIESDKYGAILIPALKQVIKEVDLTNKRMSVLLLDGLIDEKRLGE
ncbi:MAG: 16S rRNA processing protein RimM [Syntrophomonadaceae bacterium]|nr:16S rRNA processing protein RimM [Syntrophomonadaceae bacterium]